MAPGDHSALGNRKRLGGSAIMKHLPPCPSLCLSWLATVALCGGATGVAMAVEVDVSVHGTPLHKLLDTGVNPSVIDLTTADKLGLPVDRGDGGEARPWASTATARPTDGQRPGKPGRDGAFRPFGRRTVSLF